jgi:hypothetical protein
LTFRNPIFATVFILNRMTQMRWRKPMKRLLVTLAAVTALGGAMAACETATPYQPNVPGNAQSGGYSEYRVAADRFRITFAGNGLTSRETVERYLLYRAAELTVNQGYDWFMTADRHTDRQTSTYVDPFYSSGFGATYGYGWRPYWRYHGAGYGWRSWDPWGPDPFWDGAVVSQVNQYEASSEIVMGRGPKPVGEERRTLDAREVLTNLGPTIQRPPAP